MAIAHLKKIISTATIIKLGLIDLKNNTLPEKPMSILLFGMHKYLSNLAQKEFGISI